jgi:ubiquitin-conjugating enzyme E2 J2
MFPSDYPFAPPAIRMHTPSGRFQPSTRLCLSISDFHPKSFNPAWSVSTILIGLMSFMTSEEMTTGSMGTSETERRYYAARSKWWNSTGGGSATKPTQSIRPTSKGVGNIKAGDGGVKFRFEWPDVDAENWEWIKRNRVDPTTGRILPDTTGASLQCSLEAAALRRRLGSSTGVGAVVHEGRAAREAGQSWLRRNKFWVAAGVIFAWVFVARIFGEGLDL